jgi:hypothetical protein
MGAVYDRRQKTGVRRKEEGGRRKSALPLSR